MNKKNIFASIAFVLLLLIVIGIITSLSQNSTTEIKVENNTQAENTTTTINNDEPVNSLAKEILFTLNPSTIDANNPYSDTKITVKSSVDGGIVSSSIISPAIELLTIKDVSLIISAGGEGNPIGLNSPIPEIKNISNKQFNFIKRLNYSNDSQLNAFFSNYNLNYKYQYIYSTEINTNNDCMAGSTDIYCGVEYVKFEKDQINNPIHIKCGANDLRSLEYCDEFVANLEIN